MAEQLPIEFEHWGNQSFADFYPVNNQTVLAHLQQTVTGAGENLVYLWGESGHGKTHLLHACCEAAHNLKQSSIYLNLAGDLLTLDSFNGLEDFDVVCLDNVEAICSNEALEHTLFHFFNRRHERQHRLIMAAGSAANNLPVNLSDLKTRLNWGLPLKLQALDDEDKLALLTFKAQKLGFDMPEKTARFLLTHYDRRLTALWAALDKLDWASLSAQRKLTVPFLKQVLPM